MSTGQTTRNMLHARSSSQPKSLHNPFLSSTYIPSKRRDSSDLGSADQILPADVAQYPLAGSQELAATNSSSPNRRSFSAQQPENTTPVSASSVRNANLSIAREESGGALLRRQSGPAYTQASVNGHASLRPDNRPQGRHHSLSSPSSTTSSGSAAPPGRQQSNIGGVIKEARSLE